MKPYVGIIAILLIACSRATTEDPVITRPAAELFAAQWTRLDCPSPLELLSPWEKDLGAGFTLYHTPGLHQMALTGSVVRLNEEYCGIGELGKVIPPNLGDDFESVGYAPVVTFNNWRIAMYHPTPAYPDNWILYNPILNYWERWDLGYDEKSEIFLVAKSN